jgi:hypothetical protein
MVWFCEQGTVAVDEIFPPINDHFYTWNGFPSRSAQRIPSPPHDQLTSYTPRGQPFTLLNPHTLYYSDSL